MMKRINYFHLIGIIMIILTSLSFEIFAQKNDAKDLDLMFYDYTIVNIDSKSIHQTSRNNHFFEIDIPKQKENEFWTVELHNSGVVADDYVSQYTSKTGVKIGPKTTAIPTKGHIVGDLSTSVSLTFNEGFVYGYIKDKTGYNYIEPLSYYDKSQRGKDMYVVYHSNDLKPTAPHKCGTTEMHDKTQEMSIQKEGLSESRLDECFEVDYAIANDFSMFEEFGSIFATEDHAIGVTNNVQTNYDNEFADELQYIIVTQFTVSTSADDDPWYDGVNGSTLLNSFRTWGNGGGFGATYDVASLWTDRNFFAIIQGVEEFSVIGLAYVGVICSNWRYNLLENFTVNPETKRVLVSHELGHNWGSGHDEDTNQHIMAPSVSTTTTWSSQSINLIDNHIASRTCLADCTSSSGPPSASFIFDVFEECTPGLVQFTNTSTGSGSLNYEWEFPGGTPSFSTQENPFVTYNTPGSFNVTLTVSNSSGSDVETQNGAIDIIGSPEPFFSYGVDGTIISFFNLSLNATSYLWDFGDGTSSTEFDPVHDFLDDGVYIVTLTATSVCGDNTKEEVIVIANPPSADFEADVQEGCASLVVQYSSNSSNNTDDFIWTFEGGTPAVSSEENPMVTYSDAGVFDVTLTVTNETGEDLLSLTDFVTVKDVPLSDFSYVLNENEVTFTNFSEGGDSYMWDFGDGNSSTEENPVHIYASDGDFDITLTATNECGDNEATSTISISLEPVASFNATGETSSCATFSIDFESTSTNNPDEFEWVFDGGTPATSTMENPIISYSTPGVYDVSLTVTNANGSNSITMPDYVTVLDEPISAFTYSEDGLTVTFVDGSVDGDTYAWDFGDGNTSDEVNPINDYAEEGIYTVTLMVTNQCGTQTSSKTINNYTPVTADFSSNVSSGCANLTVEFGDESSANVTDWLWTFEGGTPATSTEENPTVTYSDAGQFDVVLIVSHPESEETITLVNYVAVSDVPEASFDHFEDLFDVDFTNTSIEGDSFLWDFGNGETSNEESPSHTYSEEGEFEVTLTATNACGFNSTTISVSINALPTAGIDAEQPSGCGPLTVQFNDASSSNVTDWAWTFEGGSPATSTDANPVVEYATAGIYNVELVVTSAAGTDMIAMDGFVEVLGMPVADIDYTLAGNVITASNIGSAGSDITWSIDGIDFNEDELIYTFPENGIYAVFLNTENECGTDMESVEIIVDVYPEVKMDNLPITVCVGDEVQLVDNSINADEKLWTIFGGDPASSTEDNPTVTYEAEGVFTLTLMVSNQYGESTQNFIDVVNVIGLPEASFVGTQTNNMVSFETTSSNSTTYAWDFGDGNMSTDENPTHSFSANGEFEVKLTVTNECGESFITETFIINSNAVTEAELADVNIYPNPAYTNLNIKLTNTESDQIQLNVLDINGKMVMSNTFSTSLHSLDVSSLTAGTYLIRLKSEEASYYKKIVILH